MPAKTVIITGAFGTLGRAAVDVFAGAGYRVAAVDLHSEPPAALSKALGEQLLSIEGCDLTNPGHAAAAVERTVAHWGGVDALINIAGGFVWETLAEGSPATWDRLYALNVKTCANMCRAAVPHLLASGGRIVNVGANAALKAAAGMGPYAAAKSGVHRLTEALAEELKGKVAVNAVLPSILDTPPNRADMPKADFTTWVAPAALAEILLFLASEAAGPITGALLPVTGGV
jgi:NAD(P)-dependent dehydrogenase (short-subunit alcohol dehydrogenase family)